MTKQHLSLSNCCQNPIVKETFSKMIALEICNKRIGPFEEGEDDVNSPTTSLK